MQTYAYVTVNNQYIVIDIYLTNMQIIFNRLSQNSAVHFSSVIVIK